MRYSLLVVPVLMIFLSGCTTLVSQPSTTPSDTGTIISGDVQEPLTNTLPGPANEYTLLFSGTRTENFTVYHTAREETKVYFINSDAKKMKVKVSIPDNTNGNFRRSHVIMPDGQSDGPFGTEMEYNLTQF